MKYELFCVVNAVGVPYHDTFSPNPEAAWRVHVWRDVPKNGHEYANVASAKIDDYNRHIGHLKANGDRAVSCVINTREVVDFDCKEITPHIEGGVEI